MHSRFTDDDIERGERNRARAFREFEDELLLFPNAEHDDCCDALVYALMSFDGLYEKHRHSGTQWNGQYIVDFRHGEDEFGEYGTA